MAFMLCVSGQGVNERVCEWARESERFSHRVAMLMSVPPATKPRVAETLSAFC